MAYIPHPERRPVLVAGASSGIGLATAQRFLAAGHRVAITQRSTAAPPLDPPAPFAGFHGSRAAGAPAGSVYPERPNSLVAVLPSVTTPASSSARARGSDASGTKSARAREP